MQTSNEIRQSFIDFFVKKHGHTFVPSSSVVPHDDPTLMFTNAGMNQFKDVFLGTGTRPYRRAVNSQKCIRVSGKHNDLEEVGRDTYHHTFFEMLGNWSFGDYYKAEAIEWAWDLLTKEWGIDKSRLHATVFGGDAQLGLDADDEALALWTKVTDIAAAHVHRFGTKDNFWMMGDTGPCGPCSEIHIDRTSDKSGGSLVNKGDARVMEIWNLVFIQYDRDAAGKLSLLPAKHVDTGMGFERVTALLQGKTSNYDTDIFAPIMDAIGKLTGKQYRARVDDPVDVAFRVVADHLRMLTFAITDGALPSNKGRGSVIRSVLRRAVRFAWQYFDQRQPFIHRLVPTLVTDMGSAFPELKNGPDRVAATIRAEEAEFLKTIERGLALFEQVAKRALALGKEISGDTAFDLYQTHGFPLDLTQLMARERGLVVDEIGYQESRRRHEDVSRGQVSQQASFQVSGGLPETYDRPKWSQAQAAGRVLGWLVENRLVRDGKLNLQDEAGLIVDKTPFYAEAGGQVGDRGIIITPSGKFQVGLTMKIGNAIVHFGRVAEGWIETGQMASLQVDPEREFTRKNHTATHLLHWALQEVLGPHVEQRGSKVKPNEFTFDFSHSAPLTEAEKALVEQLVNEKVYADLPVQWRELPIKEAQKLRGVRAFFGEKYGEVVRVVEIGDGFSREFCGGTHLEHTGQIGFFKIIGEESVSKGVRRLTAVTAKEAVAAVQREDAVLTELTNRFRCKLEDLPTRIEALQDESKKLQQQLKKGTSTDLVTIADRLLAQASEIQGAKIIVGELPPAQDEQIRQQVDRLRQRAGSAVVLVGWSQDSKVQLIAAVTEDLVKKGLHAGKLVGQVAKVVDGGGGGKPTMAQAGGKNPGKLNEALALGRKLAEGQLSQ
jgi:alanyl-tRNA synthetase